MRASGADRRRPSPYPRPVVAEAARTAPKRSSVKRRRLAVGAAAVAIAAAVSAGYLSSSTAYAEGDENTVTFNGDCGLLGAGIIQKSTPDKSELEIVEGTEVTFVNNLSSDGTLLIGKKSIELEEGDAYTVTLKNSSEAVLAPDCPINRPEKAEKATITVTAAPVTETPGDSDPANPPPGDSTPDDPADGEVGVPDDGEAPLKDKDPVAADKVPDPNAEDGDDTEGTDTVVGDPTGDDAGTTPAGDVEAVDTSTVQQGSSGVLAILATVCLVGVGVAAARTMVGTRAAARA
ncbi:hypothetical protein [Stackebrandtia soli]|uniref:hypothetical protein n=1 Tax=Stackebrandtia soli TaxID=1892856 RepID=UPI0039EBD0CB